MVWQIRRLCLEFLIISFLFDLMKVIKDPGVRESNLGDLQGIVYRDAVKVCPKAHEAFTSPKSDQEIPVSASFYLGILLIQRRYLLLFFVSMLKFLLTKEQ